MWQTPAWVDCCHWSSGAPADPHGRPCAGMPIVTAGATGNPAPVCGSSAPPAAGDVADGGVSLICGGVELLGGAVDEGGALDEGGADVVVGLLRHRVSQGANSRR
jgi:hypothetical protein